MFIKPHRRANIRKSEIKLDSAFNLFAVTNNRDVGIVAVSIITVVLGGREMAFWSLECRWSGWFWDRDRAVGSAVCWWEA